MAQRNDPTHSKAGTFGGLLAATYFLTASARMEFFYRLPPHRQEVHWLALKRACEVRYRRTDGRPDGR